MTNPPTKQPAIGSFEEAALFQLAAGLALTPAQRLQDLEAMIEFAAVG